MYSTPFASFYKQKQSEWSSAAGIGWPGELKIPLQISVSGQGSYSIITPQECTVNLMIMNYGMGQVG